MIFLLDNDLYTKYGVQCENEAEFQSYYIINHIHSEIFEHLDKITTDTVRDSPRIHWLLKVTFVGKMLLIYK